MDKDINFFEDIQIPTPNLDSGMSDGQKYLVVSPAKQRDVFVSIQYINSFPIMTFRNFK